MQAAIALAKLAVKNVRLDLDTGVGGIPELTPEDVAAALAGCKPVAYYLGLYKFAGDQTVLNDLEKQVFAHIGLACLAEERFSSEQYSAMCRYRNNWHSGWLLNSNGLLNDDELAFCKIVHQLVTLLVDEVVFENRHKVCGGTGQYQYRICKGCGGSGRKLVSVSEQARRLNVTHHVYVQHWQPLFERFVPMMHGFEQSVLSHLNRKLHD